MSEKYYLYIITAYEEKLKQLMDEESFTKFATEVGKNGFKVLVDGMRNGEFKDFCIENMNDILGEQGG